MRAALAAGAVAVAAALLPLIPAIWAVALCLAVGAGIALPDAAGAAVRHGHGLAVFAEGGVVRRLTGGGALRVLILWPIGTLFAAFLLLRLAGGGAAVWLTAAAAVPVALAAEAVIAAFLSREARGPHGARWSRWLARLVAVGAVLSVSFALGAAGVAPDLLSGPQAQSALVAEALAFMRLADGVQAAMLGQAAALGLLPAWEEAAIFLLLEASVALAAASLALAAAMPVGEWRRAIAPASDAPAPPPASPAALVAAGVVAAAVLAAALHADARLAAVPEDARPVAAVQVAVERIGDAFYPPGTIAAQEGAAARIAGTDAAIRAALPAAIDAGFDRMVANVDPFLDDYYTLLAEYLRLWRFVTFRLEDRLAADLEAALMRGDPLREFEALRAEAAALGSAVPVAPPPLDLGSANPARLRVRAALPAPVPLPVPVSPGFTTTVAERIAIGGVGGTLAALVARRIVGKLAARGVLRLVASAAGLPVAVLGDWILVKAEEALNREAFRAEIVAGIEAARTEALAVLR